MNTILHCNTRHSISIIAATLILSNLILAQVQATIANQVITEGIQCSSTGIGVGKNVESANDMAELNRVKAETKAKRKGKHSFTNKTGGGAAICEKVSSGLVSILIPSYRGSFWP